MILMFLMFFKNLENLIGYFQVYCLDVLTIFFINSEITIFQPFDISEQLKKYSITDIIQIYILAS